MTPLQKATLRAKEIRVRMATLGDADPTEETRSEITTLKAEYADIETREHRVDGLRG